MSRIFKKILLFCITLLCISIHAMEPQSPPIPQLPDGIFTLDIPNFPYSEETTFTPEMANLLSLKSRFEERQDDGFGRPFIVARVATTHGSAFYYEAYNLTSQLSVIGSCKDWNKDQYDPLKEPASGLPIQFPILYYALNHWSETKLDWIPLMNIATKFLYGSLYSNSTDRYMHYHCELEKQFVRAASLRDGFGNLARASSCLSYVLTHSTNNDLFALARELNVTSRISQIPKASFEESERRNALLPEEEFDAWLS